MKKGDTKGQRLKINIDDFGTGLSNMDLVNMYEPDIVKLDRDLISVLAVPVTLLAGLLISTKRKK